MQGKRFLWFLGMIAVGVAVGLIFGWLIHPIKSTHPAGLDTLRTDYKTDYVLMTAEIYHDDHNLAQATQRLSQLSSAAPARSVADAQKSAQALGYDASDRDKIAELANALQSSPTSTTGAQP